MSAAADDRRRQMDRDMASVMANHATILSNQEWVVTQLTHQHGCTEALKKEVELMRVVVEDLRKLMNAMQVLGAITKYGAVTGAAFISAWHGIKAAFQLWK